MTIEQLNSEFGLAGRLRFVEGQGGFPVAEIDNGLAKARISVYGGQLLSFQPADEPEDLMFLSHSAYYQEGKAIKGGAPVCWPWFGPDPEGAGASGPWVCKKPSLGGVGDGSAGGRRYPDHPGSDG